ncbi:MAG: hypothetical protein ACTS3T_01290 [Almyronema sp.]
MNSQLLLNVLATAPLAVLMALIHRAIAPTAPFSSQQIKPLIDLAWDQFDQNQLDAALETFYCLLVVAQQHNHTNGIEVAINGLQLTAQEISRRRQGHSWVFVA